MWNWRGKKYKRGGNLKFEGNYWRGKRNGKGKEYDEYSGKLIFEGEYLNGQKWNEKIKDMIIIAE